jgi:hypothetical protein
MHPQPAGSLFPIVWLQGSLARHSENLGFVLELIRGARFDDFSRNSILGESLGSVWCCNTGCVKLRHTNHKPDIAEYHSSEYRSSDYLYGNSVEAMVWCRCVRLCTILGGAEIGFHHLRSTLFSGCFPSMTTDQRGTQDRTTVLSECLHFGAGARRALIDTEGKA